MPPSGSYWPGTKQVRQRATISLIWVAAWPVRERTDARLYRKGPGKEAKLCFIGHGLMENRHGLLVDTCLTPAGGHAERVAALAKAHSFERRAAMSMARLWRDQGKPQQARELRLRSTGGLPRASIRAI